MLLKGVFIMENSVAVFESSGWETVWSASEGPAAEPGPIREQQAECSELRRFSETVLYSCVWQ